MSHQTRFLYQPKLRVHGPGFDPGMGGRRTQMFILLFNLTNTWVPLETDEHELL